MSSQFYNQWIGLAILAAGSFFGFSGCEKTVSRESFLAAYESKAQVMAETEDYLVTAMPLSPDYLLAKDGDSTWGPAQAAEFAASYRKANYVLVEIHLKNPTGSPSDLGKDFVNGSLLEGEEAFHRRVAFLQNEAATGIRLKCRNGLQLPPTTYRFTRGTGMPGVHTFLLLFPKEKEGQAVALDGATLELKDLGLAPEPVRLTLHPAPSLALKLKA